MSRERLQDHRRIWARKPLLAEIYAVWFDALLDQVPPGARVLEVGAGPGFLGAHAREKRPDLRWIASELIETPWNTVTADGLRLPFHDAVFETVVALDLIHHLARPVGFLEEAARVLRAGGRVAVVEPWVTPLSYPVYRWFHQETCTLGIDPRAPFDSCTKDAFDGDAAVPWRLVRDLGGPELERIGFHRPRVVPLNGFAYLLSLGFREASLLPRGLGPLLAAADRKWAGLARWIGLRALVVWERTRT